MLLISRSFSQSGDTTHCQRARFGFVSIFGVTQHTQTMYDGSTGDGVVLRL